MGGRHHSGRDAGGRLYVPGHSPVHRMAAHVKIVALVLFVLAVVATPPRAVWAFLAYAAILAAVAASAGLSARLILPRMLVEVPFLLFAVLMPVFGPEPYSQVLGLSVPGLWAAWGIIAKATIGVVGSVILAATTPTRDLLGGLAQLRVPDLMVQIAGFMIRYLDVVADEMHRMSLARSARGFQPRGLRAWPVLARSAGALFIRAYERGERVHLAMLSRGYSGSMPALATAQGRTQWLPAAALPLAGAVICLAATLVTT